MRVHPVELRRFIELSGDSPLDKIDVWQPLVADAFLEELVEVKLVVHEEFNTACVKLRDLFVHDARIREDVEIEWPHWVSLLRAVPFEGAKADLESIHSLTIVFEFLVPILGWVVVMLLVIEANA